VAAFVKDAPLHRIGFKPCSISGKIIQAKFIHAPREPLAYLAAHLAETRPVQVELRQRPLQKGCAIRFVHWAPGSSSLAVIVNRRPTWTLCHLHLKRPNDRKNFWFL
jgi:hypothetical protein